LVGGLMCYAEHHLKRMLAYSTICHAGIMLIAIALGGPFAFTALLVYVLGHAFVKGGLFLTSGILLHRVRAIGERALFGKGKSLPWTGFLWFLGALGLAAAPPYILMIADGGISRSAEQFGLGWVTWISLFGATMTSAAVLRTGMHTFFGWGSEPITDEAAEVGELPETREEDQGVFWYQFCPAAVAILIPIVLTFVPGWLNRLNQASAVFADQSAMQHLIYTGVTATTLSPVWQIPLLEATIRGASAFLLALLLACTSVFRERLTRKLRVGAFLESGVRPLRLMQSGHPGDYVLWTTIGLAVIGSVELLLLR
jgi:multicomponent Na+:H+ antiporter subunit D